MAENIDDIKARLVHNAQTDTEAASRKLEPFNAAVKHVVANFEKVAQGTGKDISHVQNLAAQAMQSIETATTQALNALQTEINNFAASL